MIDPIRIIEKHYTKGTALYKLLLLHSTQVKNKALDIVKKHPELDVDVEFIKEAAMLHDIGIVMCNAPKIHCMGEHTYIEHGYLGAEMLRAEGLDRHAWVCERHTGTGLTKKTIIEQNFPIPHREMLPIGLEEQMICYADKFYSKSRPKEAHTVEAIIKDLSRFGAEQVITFEKWDTMFG